MPKNKEKTTGICRLCKVTKELSFTHFPPSSAYNKNTKYFSIPHDEYFKNAEAESLLEYKPKGRKLQGGLGDNCLCKDCNYFLGSAYYKGLVKVTVQCTAETFLGNQSLVLCINICGENRHLRQATNCYAQ